MNGGGGGGYINVIEDVIILFIIILFFLKLNKCFIVMLCVFCIMCPPRHVLVHPVILIFYSNILNGGQSWPNG